jgi:sterol desaturase/sphingolipid hydroxylase (fatty acid hydroxylase superfamily)
MIHLLLIFGALGFVYLGLSLRLPPSPVVAAAGVLTALICLELERRTPFSAEWSRSRDDRRTNAAHFVFSMVAVIALFQQLAFAPLWSAGRALGSDIWPRGWPLPVQLGLALFIAELGYYWIHRLSHEWAWLWRFHEVHHSLPRLYWLNAGHFHPIDTLLNYAAEVTPLLLLGAGAEVLALYSVFTSVNGMLKHSNIQIRLGALNWILSSAELHRWHHAPDPKEGNTNYGSNLILWDLIFGTRFLPARPPPLAIGLADETDYPRGFREQLARPFRERPPYPPSAR